MSTRLWFRTDDVHPLAEHAMACTTHRPTTAQDRAQIPTGPALTWTGNRLMDVLVSTGLPAWYGERGADHAAVAHTWRHATTGRFGTAWTEGHTTAVLPLDVAADGVTVIEALREARFSNRHWVTLDIDPADGPRIAGARLATVDHRDETVPADTTWTPATVTCTTVADRRYPALVPDGYTTDAGFALPRFDRLTTVRMVVDAINSQPVDGRPGDQLHLRLTDNAVVVLAEHHDGRHSTYRQVDLIHPDPQGHYAVGAHRWPWRTVADDAQQGR